MSKPDVTPEERARVKAKFDQYLIGVQVAQQADEINYAKKRKDGMKSHDAYWNLDPGDTIRGYKITKPSFQTGDAEGRDD